MLISREQRLNGFSIMYPELESPQKPRTSLWYGGYLDYLESDQGEDIVTDYTNASRTMLFDIRRLTWDEKILEELDIPVQMLPEVKPSSCIYGYSDRVLFGEAIAIAGAAGDQQAALFGQCCHDKGEVKNTYGTGCFLLMNTGSEAIVSKHGLITTIAASTGQEVSYALEGSVFVAGAAVQWLRDELQLIRNAAESEKYALQVPNTMVSMWFRHLQVLVLPIGISMQEEQLWG
jgi:glycerol kinase